jgi:hypothetical protein
MRSHGRYGAAGQAEHYNPCNMFPPQPQPGGYDLTGWNTNPAGADPVEVAMWGNYYASGR